MRLFQFFFFNIVTMVLKSLIDPYNDSKLIRVSPGFGFSMPSPFGRLRLDFGFPLVKESYDIIPSPNVKFSIEAGI